MAKTRESNGSGALYLGTLIVIVSVVIWSEYKTYYLGTWIALCAGGFVLWFIGFASTKHLASASRTALMKAARCDGGRQAKRESYQSTVSH